MTSAEYRALQSGKAPVKPLAAARVPRSPLPAPKETREPGEAGRSQEITFPGKVPGLNGAGGLLRMHWRRAQQLKQGYLLLVKAGGLRSMLGPVRLELVRYSTGRDMDYENLTSTGKYPTDALVKAGILPDDNPQVIPERVYTQARCRPDEQRTVIRLTAL